MLGRSADTEGLSVNSTTYTNGECTWTDTKAPLLGSYYINIRMVDNPAASKLSMSVADYELSYAQALDAEMGNSKGEHDKA